MGCQRFTFILLCAIITEICTYFANAEIKRQGLGGDGTFVGAPARDLLPPPALSASFPTLRPQLQFGRNNNNNANAQLPHREAISPFTLPVANRFPPSTIPVVNSKEEIKLLPPIEIPPEKPLTDAEIAQLSFVDSKSSFIPTTGQGLGEGKDHVQITVAEPVTKPVVPATSAALPQTLNDNKNSTPIVSQHSAVVPTVKFPETPVARPTFLLPRNCPVCECTSEVDYICASNGAIYLNSCSFDCATFCEEGLRKLPLEFCASTNHL